MKVKRCRDCKHSMPEPNNEWALLCMNPEVNAKDPWALAGAKAYGSRARLEREKTWWRAACGMKGKLWEVK